MQAAKIIRLIAFVAVVIVGIALILQRTGADASVQMTHGVKVGTLNGKPLFVPERNPAAAFAMLHDRPPTTSSADQQEVAAIRQSEVCAAIKTEIEGVAREAAQKEFRISISREELASVTAKTRFDPAGIEQQRKQLVTNNLAAAEVFDQHQDPERVFETLILPLWKGWSREQAHKVWESNLVVWGTPEGRMRLAKAAAAANSSNWNSKQVTEGMAKGMERHLLSQKLDESVIAKLADQDPKFRLALEEHQRHGGIPLTAGVQITTPGLQYISDKINGFWRVRYAQQQVVLDDPKLAEKCQLSAFGPEIANR